jgi:hypothetical protein
MAFTNFSGVVGGGVQFDTFFNQGSGPMLVCPTSGCTTIIGSLDTPLLGTSQFEFWDVDAFSGEGRHNLIRFDSSGSHDVSRGQSFLMGSLTLSNGIWFTAPDISVTFRSSSSDPAFDGFVWTDTIRMSITPNDFVNKTPEQNADFIYLLNRPDLGSVRAYEANDSPTGSNSVTVDLYGAINSIDLQRFANARGAGFIDSSVALEPTISAVTEPTTMAFLGTGLAGLLVACRRRAKVDRAHSA